MTTGPNACWSTVKRVILTRFHTWVLDAQPSRAEALEEVDAITVALRQVVHIELGAIGDPIQPADDLGVVAALRFDSAVWRAAAMARCPSGVVEAVFLAGQAVGRRDASMRAAL